MKINKNQEAMILINLTQELYELVEEGCYKKYRINLSTDDEVEMCKEIEDNILQLHVVKRDIKFHYNCEGELFDITLTVQTPTWLESLGIVVCSSDIDDFVLTNESEFCSLKYRDDEIIGYLKKLMKIVKPKIQAYEEERNFCKICDIINLISE